MMTRGSIIMSRTPDLMAKIALLRGAEEVFAAHGLEDAKVEEISRRAGLSKGSFYLHFESKEEAFKQVVEGFLARFSSMVVEPDDRSQLPVGPDETLSFVMAEDLTLFEFLWQNRDVVSIVDSCHGDFSYMLEGFHRTMIDASKKWLEHWKKVGVLRREVDVDVAAVLVNGAYQSLARMMMAQKHRPPLEAWIEETVTLFFVGMGAPATIEAAIARQKKRKATVSEIIVTRRPRKRPKPSRQRVRGSL
jgi:AcrR family transcriptional regulator